MAVKTIETRAKITAEDRTGTTFAQVAQKLRRVGDTAGQVNRRLDGVARGMSDVGRRAAFHQDVARRMSSVAPAAAAATMRGADMAYLSRVAAAVAGSAVVIGVAKSVADRIVKAGSEREGERLNRDIAGITPKEQKDIVFAGGALSDQHRSITRTDAEAMLRDARTIVGSTEGALAIGDTLAQLRVVLQRLDPTGDINKQLNDFTRAADLSGATKDPETFKRFANSYAKMQGAFPGIISPLEMTEYAKKSHGAAMKFSPEFTAGVVPSLIQGSGGASTGEMLASFNRNIVDERLDKKAKKTLASYGLVKGGHIVERDLAASDPYLWTQNILRPALARHGVTDTGKQAQLAGSLFSDATAAEVVKRFIENREGIERDRQKAREAWDLRQAKEIEQRDLGTALTSVSSQATNVGAVLGEKLAPAATDAAHGLAEFLSNTQKQLEAHPVFGPELGETTVIGGPRNPIAPLKGAWRTFWDNSRDQFSIPIGSDVPESVAMPRQPLDLSGIRSIPAGPGKFGFGPNGAPANWDALAAGLRGGTIRAEAELKGDAAITNRVVVEPSPEFLVKIDQRIEARGALRTDGGASTGISMPSEH